MKVEATRRGFLAGLFGTAVIVEMPKTALALVEPLAPDAIAPWAIIAPPSTTYQWVRTALLGVPDPANVQARIDNGWKFVVPDLYPGAPVSTVEKAIETRGMILMEKPTADVQQSLAAERAAWLKAHPMAVPPIIMDLPSQEEIEDKLDDGEEVSFALFRCEKS